MSVFIVMETARVHLHVHVYMYTLGMFIHTLMHMYNDNEYVNFVHLKI